MGIDPSRSHPAQSPSIGVKKQTNKRDRRGNPWWWCQQWGCYCWRAGMIFAVYTGWWLSLYILGDMYQHGCNRCWKEIEKHWGCVNGLLRKLHREAFFVLFGLFNWPLLVRVIVSIVMRWDRELPWRCAWYHLWLPSSSSDFALLYLAVAFPPAITRIVKCQHHQMERILHRRHRDMATHLLSAIFAPVVLTLLSSHSDHHPRRSNPGTCGDLNQHDRRITQIQNVETP